MFCGLSVNSPEVQENNHLASWIAAFPGCWPINVLLNLVHFRQYLMSPYVVVFLQFKALHWSQLGMFHPIWSQMYHVVIEPLNFNAWRSVPKSQWPSSCAVLDKWQPFEFRAAKRIPPPIQNTEKKKKKISQPLAIRIWAYCPVLLTFPRVFGRHRATGGGRSISFRSQRIGSHRTRGGSGAERHSRPSAKATVGKKKHRCCSWMEGKK